MITSHLQSLLQLLLILPIIFSHPSGASHHDPNSFSPPPLTPQQIEEMCSTTEIAPWYYDNLEQCTVNAQFFSCMKPGIGVKNCWSHVCQGDPTTPCLQNANLLSSTVPIDPRCCTMLQKSSNLFTMIESRAFTEEGVTAEEEFDIVVNVDLHLANLTSCEKAFICDYEYGGEKNICLAELEYSLDEIKDTAVRDGQAEVIEFFDGIASLMGFYCMTWRYGEYFHCINYDCRPEVDQKAEEGSSDDNSDEILTADDGGEGGGGGNIDSDRLLVFGGGAFLLLVASIFFVRQGKGSASKKEAGAVAVTAAAATAAPVAVAVAIEP